MEQVAANTNDGMSYQGVALAGNNPEIVYDVPGDGIDAQDTETFWLLPGGKCE